MTDQFLFLKTDKLLRHISFFFSQNVNDNFICIYTFHGYNHAATTLLQSCFVTINANNRELPWWLTCWWRQQKVALQEVNK